MVSPADKPGKGIEGNEKILVHMKLLGQRLGSRSEPQPLHLGHFRIIGGNARHHFFKVLRRDGIGSRTPVRESEAAPTNRES